MMDYYENPTRAESFIDILISDYGVTDQSLQRVLAAIGEGKVVVAIFPPYVPDRNGVDIGYIDSFFPFFFLHSSSHVCMCWYTQ